MTGPDGMESWGVASYKEIEAPKRLVYTDQFADVEGKALEGMPEMLITVDFIEQEGRTKVVSHTLFPSEENLQKVVEMGVEQGFGETWDRLADYLAE